MISTRLALCSHGVDQRHRTSKQGLKSRTPSHINHKSSPYRSDFRAESRQETHLTRNSNLTGESAQQPENGPPSQFWYNQYVGEPRSNGGHHGTMKYSHGSSEEGNDRNYHANHPVRQTESEFRDTSKDKYRNNEAPDMQYHYNQDDGNMHYSHNREVNSSRGNEPLYNGDKYAYPVNDDASQYPRYEKPEGYNRPPSYTHSAEYISDKTHKEQMYLKSDREYYQPHPYTSFSNSSSSSFNEHRDDHLRTQNEQMPHQDNPQSPKVEESHYSSKYRPETQSNSGYKHSGYPEEPYSSGYRDSPQHYHTNSQKANSRLPQEPYPVEQYTEQPEIPNNNFNSHNRKLKGSSLSEQSHVHGGGAHENHQRNTHGPQYETRDHHQQFRGKTHSQESLSEESSISDDKNSSQKKNGKVSMRVVATKKDMQQAPSETESSIAEEHDGFLDMGAYTDKQGSFGWYADFPVGKEHDKVTYSFS